MKSENWWKSFLLGTKQPPTRCQRDSAPNNSIGFLKYRHSLNARFQNDEGTDDVTAASSKEDPFDDDGSVAEDSVKTSIAKQSRQLLSLQRTSLIRPQKTDDILSFKFDYFCSLCNKQYNRQREIDNHLQSYDHAHRQRLRDLRRGELCRRAWFERRRRRRRRLKKSKTEDKDFDRMMKFANERAEVFGTAIKMQQQQQQQQQQIPSEDIAAPPASSETSDREDFSKQAINFDDNFKRNFLCRNDDDDSTGKALSSLWSRIESAMDATTKDSQRPPPPPPPPPPLPRIHVDVGGSALEPALSNIPQRKATATSYLLKYSRDDHINRKSTLRRNNSSRKNKSRKSYQQFQGSESFKKTGKSNFEECLRKKSSQEGRTQQQQNGNSAKSRKFVGDRNRQNEASFARRKFRGKKKEAVIENRCDSSPLNCRISSIQKYFRKATLERLRNCRQLCSNLKTVDNIKDSMWPIKLRSNLSASHSVRTCDKATLAPNNFKVPVCGNKWLAKDSVVTRTRKTEYIPAPSGIDRTSRYSQCTQITLRADLANAGACAQFFKTAKSYGDEEFTPSKLDQGCYDADATDRTNEVISSTKSLNFYSKDYKRNSSFERNSNSKTSNRIVRSRSGKCRSQENYFLLDDREKDETFSGGRDFFQAIGPNDPLVFKASVDEKSERILPLRLESMAALRRTNLTKRSFQWQPINDSKKPKLKDNESKRWKSARNETREHEAQGCFAGILLLKSKFPLNIGHTNEFLAAPNRGFNGRWPLNDVPRNIFLMLSECQPTLSIKPNVPLSTDSTVDHMSPNHLPSSSLSSSSSSSSSVKTPLSAFDGCLPANAESNCLKTLEDLASKGRSAGHSLAADAALSSPLISRRPDSGRPLPSTFLALLPPRGYCFAEVPPAAAKVFKSTEPFRVCRSQVPQFLPSKVWLFGCRPRLAHEIRNNTGGSYGGSFYGNATPWNLCVPRHLGLGYRWSDCAIDSQLFGRPPHLVMIPLPLPVSFCVI